MCWGRRVHGLTAGPGADVVRTPEARWAGGKQPTDSTRLTYKEVANYMVFILLVLRAYTSARRVGGKQPTDTTRLTYKEVANYMVFILLVLRACTSARRVGGTDSNQIVATPQVQIVMWYSYNSKYGVSEGIPGREGRPYIYLHPSL